MMLQVLFNIVASFLAGVAVTWVVWMVFYGR